MLACVLVIGEGFLEAVWKEADSSAPLAQWLWARALPPSSANPSVVWDSPGTRPVGGEPCRGLASSRCLISDLVLLPQVRSQGGQGRKGECGLCCGNHSGSGEGQAWVRVMVLPPAG